MSLTFIRDEKEQGYTLEYCEWGTWKTAYLLSSRLSGIIRVLSNLRRVRLGITKMLVTDARGNPAFAVTV